MPRRGTIDPNFIVHQVQEKTLATIADYVIPKQQAFLHAGPAA